MGVYLPNKYQTVGCSPVENYLYHWWNEVLESQWISIKDLNVITFTDINTLFSIVRFMFQSHQSKVPLICSEHFNFIYFILRVCSINGYRMAIIQSTRLQSTNISAPCNLPRFRQKMPIYFRFGAHKSVKISYSICHNVFIKSLSVGKMLITSQCTSYCAEFPVYLNTPYDNKRDLKK